MAETCRCPKCVNRGGSVHHADTDRVIIIDGRQGPEGPSGKEGPTGPTGLRGGDGPQGSTGPTGVRGPVGQSSWLLPFSASTLPASGSYIGQDSYAQFEQASLVVPGNCTTVRLVVNLRQEFKTDVQISLIRNNAIVPSFVLTLSGSMTGSISGVENLSSGDLLALRMCHNADAPRADIGITATLVCLV